ncbi:MAG: hypothetical protein AAF441_22845 [Pseudomonadota bacterium]
MAQVFGKQIVWTSRSEGADKDAISVLACAEVALSVTAYWWIATTYDTYAILLMAAVATPLVLLRSDQSVELGVRWFKRYFDAWVSDDAPANPTVLVSAVLACLGTVALGTIGTQILLAEYDGWSLVWRSAILCWLGLNIGIATAGAAAPVGVGLFVVLGKPVESLLGTAGTVVLFAMVCVGLFLGLLLRAVATRLLASLRYAHFGAANVPTNWQRLLFQVDVLKAPELLPNADRISDRLDFIKFTDGLRGEDLKLKIALGVAIPIWFPPSLLYRYALKSTFWLYAPLIYVFSIPAAWKEPGNLLDWAEALPSMFIEWLRLGMALVTLGLAGYALYDAAGLGQVLGAMGEAPLTVFHLALVLDWSRLQPWHFFTLPSAALTVILFFWLDVIRRQVRALRKRMSEEGQLAEGAAIPLPPGAGWKLRAAVIANQLRTLCVSIWMALALYYFADFAYAQCKVFDWMITPMSWIFGPQAC